MRTPGSTAGFHRHTPPEHVPEPNAAAKARRSSFGGAHSPGQTLRQPLHSA